jgi:hypothetical protein
MKKQCPSTNKLLCKRSKQIKIRQVTPKKPLKIATAKLSESNSSQGSASPFHDIALSPMGHHSRVTVSMFDGAKPETK